MYKIKFRGTDKYFDVQNVFCVGKNYAAHVKEMSHPGKNEKLPDTPVIFLKSNSSIVAGDCKVEIPFFREKKISSNLQNEVELVILIGRDGVNIPENKTGEYIAGYSVGIDFTLRDLQSVAKAEGLPWTISKSFIKSAPVSDAVTVDELPDAGNLEIGLKVNGETKQEGNTSQMIFSINYIVHYISSIFGLRKGDIIFTGTPSGVTKLNRGDIVSAYIEKIGVLKVEIG